MEIITNPSLAYTASSALADVRHSQPEAFKPRVDIAQIPAPMSEATPPTPNLSEEAQGSRTGRVMDWVAKRLTELTGLENAELPAERFVAAAGIAATKTAVEATLPQDNWLADASKLKRLFHTLGTPVRYTFNLNSDLARYKSAGINSDNPASIEA